jgi:hypothetical protein
MATNRKRSIEEMKSRLNIDQIEPIDEQEQADIINELKSQALAQTQSFRNLFSIVFYGIAGIFCVCAVYTVYFPWEMQHQKHFQSLIPDWAFLGHYIGSVFCFVAAAMVVKVRNICCFS